MSIKATPTNGASVQRGQSVSTDKGRVPDLPPVSIPTANANNLNPTPQRTPAAQEQDQAGMSASVTNADQPRNGPAAGVAQRILDNTHNLAPPVLVNGVYTFILSAENIPAGVNPDDVANLLKTNIHVRYRDQNNVWQDVPADKSPFVLPACILILLKTPSRGLNYWLLGQVRRCKYLLCRLKQKSKN